MSETTGKLSAALADRYRIERHLGEGGMATVYLAEDLKHQRKVAVKVLRPELAAVLGAERFVQEITTTANLQHPHILPLFDSGEADGFLYYVMPFIDGETLRDKLNRETQLGIDEAVKITTEIADALDYAHRNSVIHRDIKPENILMHDGRPMVADFGIALAVSAAAGGRMTETGLSLGTPHYMSPEQATAEKDITSRSDIYSLASVLYEMLTGEPPHTGGSAQAVIMKIVTEPAAPVTRIRKSVPPNVAAATSKALEKLGADRFTSARAFAEALTDPHFSSPTSVADSTASARGGQRRLNATVAIVAVLSLLFAAWGWLGRPRLPEPQVVRMQATFPSDQALVSGALGPNLILSNDGSFFVYSGPSSTAGWQLWLRRMDALDAVPIPGTDHVAVAALSPDGREVAFARSVDRELRVTPVSGGVSRTVVDSVRRGGLAWGDDGMIYSRSLASGIERIDPTDGHREVIVLPETAGAGLGYLWPDVLPGGTGILFSVHESVNLNDAVIGAVRFGSSDVTILTRGVYARATTSGHLLWVTAQGTLMAASFDERSLALGSPAVLLEGVRVEGTLGAADFSVSRTGRFIYQTGQAGEFEVAWVNRDGSTELTGLTGITPWLGGGLALSPDGSRLVFSRRGERADGSDIWVMQMASGTQIRLTTVGANSSPGWSPDGQSVVFTSARTGVVSTGIFEQRADGTGQPQPVMETPVEGFSDGPVYSSDGQWIVFRQGNLSGATGSGIISPEGGIFAIRPGVDSVGIPLAASDQFRERAAALSPDNRWLAYASDETGRDEVYVRPFPNVQDGKWVVSQSGGTEPVWARTSPEIFYRNGNNAMVAARFEVDPTFRIQDRTVLFSATGFGSQTGTRMYDVSPDGQRFIMVLGQLEGQALIFVENFFETLRVEVPN